MVGRLIEQGVDRYDVASSDDPIDPGNVWDAIEPATAISTRLLRGHDGWAEGLGTGADSPWQSSALADLLLQLALDATVAWEPDFLVHGEGFTRGATGAELNAKVRSYGRGYGRVLSTWHYPVRRRVGCVVKPLLQRGYRVGPDVLPLPARVAAAVGRAEGILGHLLPGASRSPRRPSDLASH